MSEKLCPHLWHPGWASQRRDKTLLYNPTCFEKTITAWKDKGDNSIKSGCQCIGRDFASYQLHFTRAKFHNSVLQTTGIHRCKFNWMGWVLLFFEKSKGLQVYVYKLQSLYIGMRREVGRMFSLVWKSVWKASHGSIPQKSFTLRLRNYVKLSATFARAQVPTFLPLHIDWLGPGESSFWYNKNVLKCRHPRFLPDRLWLIVTVVVVVERWTCCGQLTRCTTPPRSTTSPPLSGSPPSRASEPLWVAGDFNCIAIYHTVCWLMQDYNNINAEVSCNCSCQVRGSICGLVLKCRVL